MPHRPARGSKRGACRIQYHCNQAGEGPPCRKQNWSRAPASRSSKATALPCGTAATVSYTHLDVYKRQEQGRARMSVTVGITNTEHLNSVVARLKKIKDVVSVTRN